MEHEYVVYAKEEISKSWVAAAVVERKWVVDGYVSAVGSAWVDVGRCRSKGVIWG